MESIYKILEDSELVNFPSDINHLPWPKINRQVFENLGYKVREKEQEVTRILPKDSCITLSLT